MLISRPTLNIIQMGVGFFFVFFAFCTQAFIVETVLESRSKKDPRISSNAGYYSQTVIYGAFIISTMISPTIIKFLTPKWSLVVGSSGYTLYMAGFLFINPYYLYISAFWEGLWAGALWTSLGHYLALNSTKENIGRNSGIVWLIYTASYFAGGIFLLIVFGEKPDKSISMSTTRILYGTFTVTAFLGNITFALLPGNSDKNIGNDKSLVKSNDQEDKSYWNEMKKSAYLLFTFDMMLLVFAFSYSGVENSFWSGVYPTSLSFTKKFKINTNKLMALNMIMNGSGEIIGGLAFGMFGHRTNKFGRYPIVVLGLFCGIIAYVIAFINVPGVASFRETEQVGIIHQPNIALALIGGFMLGLADACINTQIYSIIAVYYPESTVQANAINKFIHAIFSTVCMFYGSVLQMQYQLLILLISHLLSTIGFIIAEIRFRNRAKIQDIINEKYNSYTESICKM